MSEGAPVRTALYQEHVALNANLVDFPWVRVTNLVFEHQARAPRDSVHGRIV